MLHPRRELHKFKNVHSQAFQYLTRVSHTIVLRCWRFFPFVSVRYVFFLCHLVSFIVICILDSVCMRILFQIFFRHFIRLIVISVQNGL